MRNITEKDLSTIPAPFHVPVQKWFKALQERALPSIDDFTKTSYELEEFRMLSKVKQDPLDVFYYEASPRLEKLYGGDLAGKNLNELYDDFFRKRAYEAYAQLIEDKQPTYEHRGFSTIIGDIGYYKLHLPFGDETVEAVATYIMPTSGIIRKRFDWTRLFDKTPWF